MSANKSRVSRIAYQTKEEAQTFIDRWRDLWEPVTALTAKKQEDGRWHICFTDKGATVETLVKLIDAATLNGDGFPLLSVELRDRIVEALADHVVA